LDMFSGLSRNILSHKRVNMSQKRQRRDSDSSERVHTHHKRFKDDNGDAQHVDPLRFARGQTYEFGDGHASLQADPFQVPLPEHSSSDELDCNQPIPGSSSHSHSHSHSPPLGEADGEFGVLLYELASLKVGNDAREDPDEPQTCPICSKRISLRDFAEHVHACLDAMDEGDRNDMRSQTEKDSDFATEYALKHGFVTDYATECPSCGKMLALGSGINEHVNRCMDEVTMKDKEQEMDGKGDDDEDDDLSSGQVKKAAAPLSRAQMISCASKLMTLQQGSQQFDAMLDMFGALGFNKENVKSVLEIEKTQNHNESHNHNQNQSHNHNNAMQMQMPMAKEDEMEDVDLDIDDDDL